MGQERRTFRIVLGTILGAILLLAPVAGFAAKAQEEPLYTAYNVWYEHPEKVWSTGYEKGTKLPVGTEVRILKRSGKNVVFEDVESGTRFTLLWTAKHHPGVSWRAFVDRFLTPKSLGELTAGFTPEEIDAIKAGEIRLGMSKQAVLVSRGFPPEIQTESIEANVWYYWKHRFGNYSVEFEDDRVAVTSQ
jgi:hypothetical protein